MFNRLTADELLNAASDAFRGDRANARSILTGLRERAGQRARGAIGTSPDAPSITSKPKPVLRPMPAPPPPRPTTVRVDGYTAVVSMQPTPARHADLETLQRSVAANERAAFDELAHQRAVVERLERENAALAARLEAVENRADQALMGVVEGVGQFKREVAKVGTPPNLSALEHADRLQQLQGVVSSLQSAAYGEQGALLSKNNLMLAGNQLAWIFAGPALQRLGIVNGSQAQMLASIAPLGSLVTGALTVGRQQHVRFITGVTNFDGTSRVAIVSLRHRIASGARAEFMRRTDIPVSVTTMSGGQFRGIAVVRNGVLSLVQTSEGLFRGQVAWMVDTGGGGG